MRKSVSDLDFARFFDGFLQTFLVWLYVNEALVLESLTYHDSGLRKEHFLLGDCPGYLCEVLRFYFSAGF